MKYNMLNVVHSCYRLKPTSGWVQSATSLIAIEGPVTLYNVTWSPNKIIYESSFG